MSSTSLRLYPANPDMAPTEIAQLFAALQTVGFITPTVVYAGNVPYAPGPRFYELIAFHASHMVMQLEIIDDQIRERGLVDSRKLCRITFSDIYPEPEFLGMGNTRPPRCPVCGQTVSDWQQAVDLWFENKTGYRRHCTFCGAEAGPAGWDWQRNAAIARFTIDIQGIRQGEAYPGIELLELLADYLGGRWDYFYCRI